MLVTSVVLFVLSSQWTEVGSKVVRRGKIPAVRKSKGLRDLAMIKTLHTTLCVMWRVWEQDLVTCISVVQAFVNQVIKILF